MTETQTVTDPNAKSDTALRIRYRIRFAKEGLLRWIGHNDLIRLWERIIRRAELPVSMSQGFHRRPRMSFPSALALGVVALDEVIDLDLCEEFAAEVLFSRLEADQQPGLRINSVQKLPVGSPKAQLASSDYSIDVPEGIDVDQVQRKLTRLLAEDHVTFERKGKTVRTLIATEIPRLELTNNRLEFTLVSKDGASIRPDNLLELLDASDWPQQGATMTRERVHLQQDYAPSSEGDDTFFSTTHS